MTSIEKIKNEITCLSKADFQSLRRWIADHDWGLWEDEIINDAATGKLDFLVNEAEKDSYSGKLESL